jgi:hypothetical protein
MAKHDNVIGARVGIKEDSVELALKFTEITGSETAFNLMIGSASNISVDDINPWFMYVWITLKELKRLHRNIHNVLLKFYKNRKWHDEQEDHKLIKDLKDFLKSEHDKGVKYVDSKKIKCIMRNNGVEIY